MRAAVKIDDSKVLGGIRAARRQINTGVREGLKRGVEKHGLPAARRLAPGRRIPNALRARATSRTAFLELRVAQAPHGPLLEFGGTRRDVLVPRDAKALKTPAGPRAAVRGPRRYKAQRYMQRAVEQTRDAVEREAAAAMAETFERAGLEVD